MDLALAGGVDISLDPFELVGFAKAGALAKDQMRVYDQRAAGFLPGEGCGFVLLKRLNDAIRDKNYVYATIKGWGISSEVMAQGPLKAIRLSLRASLLQLRNHLIRAIKTNIAAELLPLNLL